MWLSIGLAGLISMLTIGRTSCVSGILLNTMTTRTRRLRNLGVRRSSRGLPLGALLVTAVGLKDWSNISFLIDNNADNNRCGLCCDPGFDLLVRAAPAGHGILRLNSASTRSIIATPTFMSDCCCNCFPHAPRGVATCTEFTRPPAGAIFGAGAHADRYGEPGASLHLLDVAELGTRRCYL